MRQVIEAILSPQEAATTFAFSSVNKSFFFYCAGAVGLAAILAGLLPELKGKKYE